MTDEELIAMARLAQRDERMSTGALYGDLADRIEALTEQLAAAQQDAKEAEAYAEELEKERDEARAAWEIEAATVRRFAERHTRHLVMGAEARDGAERAEVKLAKAVELLTLCRDMFGEVASPSDPLSVMLNETLAEIKGESHD